ncbi:hypothetical protein Tco_0234916, partial [Tanacetum coccineum]
MASSPKIDSLFDEFTGELITIPPRISLFPHFLSPLRIVTLLGKRSIYSGLCPDDSIPPGIESDDYDSEDSTIDVVEDIPVDVPNILPTHLALQLDFNFIPSNDLGSDLDDSSPFEDRNKIYDPGLCIEVEATKFISTL